MKPFLKEIARKIYEKHPETRELTLVFPNRRAVLYFRKHLVEIITKPVFAPTLITIEEFIGGFSSLKVPDKLELIHQLYETYRAVMGSLPGSRNETFDQFYFWGDMLLRDFDEVDKYLVNASGLFKDLTNLKEIESGLDYLTDQQKSFLLEFWKSFGENITENKRNKGANCNQIGAQLHHHRNLYQRNLHVCWCATDQQPYRERSSGQGSP